jgi:hypothetical protein
MIEIAPGIVYDDTQGLWDQEESVRKYLTEALPESLTSVQNEVCDGGNQRITKRVYTLPQAVLEVIYEYINTASSPEWAGIKRKIVQVYAK